MRRRDVLRLGPAAVLALAFRPRVMAADRPRVRRSKPFVEGLERSGLTREQIRELEEMGRC
jgi:hypothetical protein